MFYLDLPQNGANENVGATVVINPKTFTVEPGCAKNEVRGQRELAIMKVKVVSAANLMFRVAPPKAVSDIDSDTSIPSTG